MAMRNVCLCPGNLRDLIEAVVEEPDRDHSHIRAAAFRIGYTGCIPWDTVSKPLAGCAGRLAGAPVIFRGEAPIHEAAGHVIEHSFPIVPESDQRFRNAQAHLRIVGECPRWVGLAKDQWSGESQVFHAEEVVDPPFADLAPDLINRSKLVREPERIPDRKSQEPTNDFVRKARHRSLLDWSLTRL
jgi:hypothetical protein